MAMSNLHGDAHGLAQIIHGDEVHAMRTQSTRIEMLISADNHLLICAINLNYVERRPGGDAQAFALAYGEIMDAAVFANYFPARGYQFPGGIGQGLDTLGEIGIDKSLVIAAGYKTNFLRVRLFGQSQAVPSRQLANLRLRHSPERK